MEKVKLPNKVDPARCAQNRLKYKGEYSAALMSRLAESTKGIHGDIDVSLDFGTDAQGLRIVSGSTRAHVSLQCQRCNELFDTTIESEFTYTPLRANAEAPELPEDYDIIEVDEAGEVSLVELIEDELILSVPQIPTHENEQCSEGQFDQSFGKLPTVEERPNPFAILEELKRK
ncbi:23S rRNA accumulation protein YceD [Oceanisphaera pacifica]|uniref:Large ribosomal RNA subunit accumulation protein YceD n=1 Tax=Oceanisphaera pacifica TaxID=2818389 RepID=A0ABS3NET2_9GAMM|nr:23S rRNA accumulation protein YceD [Oceanisphaera pacifica]MBO1518791.1 23S rRNA accumulation protein YceD [Oceanisphaera pacifica]